MIKINCFRALILTCTIIIATGTVRLNAQCVETFEDVTPPDLPDGWSVSTLLGCSGSFGWVTSEISPINGNLSVYVSAPDCASDEVMYSRYYSINSNTSQLSFNRSHDMELGWDGMVLEISMGGSDFVDILDAGGSFFSGGYDLTLNSSTNPLSDRQAWSGITGTVNTVVNLPASANGQIVRFRWRRGTDGSIGGIGAYIDDVSLTGCSTTTACAEDFTSLTVPALPAGWSVATALDCASSNPWVTVNSSSDSPPNSVFINNPGCVSDEYLYSKIFQIISPNAQLTFKLKHDLQDGYDGLVLEISVDGEPFSDIEDAGGNFDLGGYNGTIDNCCGNPLADRFAWTGTTGGNWITSIVNIPESADGKIVIFRWRRGTDADISDQGAFIDDVSVSGSLCNTSCSGSILLSQSATSLCTGPALLSASGGAATYEWYKNNVIIEGETGSSYSATTEGIYFVRSFVGDCMTISNVVVVGPGSIEPILGSSGIYCDGDNVSIGMPDTENSHQYTWMQNGVAVYSIPVGGGGGNQSLNFLMEASRAGTYRVESSIPGCLPVYTNEVYVGSPVITGLQAVSICHEEVLVKWNRVVPEFVSQNYEYQISLSSVPDLADAETSDSSVLLFLDPVTTYYFHVRSSCGFSSTFGEWSTISFTTPAPNSISLAPLNANLCTGPVQLTVTGGGPVYAWYKDGELIDGATGSTYNATSAGDYQVKWNAGSCVISSNVAAIEPGITVIPNVDGSGTYCGGSIADVRVIATEFSQDYKWILNGVVKKHIPIGGGGGNQSLNVTVNAATEGIYVIETFKSGCPVETSFVDVELSKITGLTILSGCATEVSFEWNSLLSENYEYEVNTSSSPPDFSSNPQTNDTTATVTGLTPATQYYIHVQGASGNGSSFCSSWTTIPFTTPAISGSPVTSIWTGNISTNWTDAGNWQCGLIPGTTTEVIVNGGLPNYPVVNSNTTIRKMTANPGATVTVSPGVILTITGN